MIYVARLPCTLRVVAADSSGLQETSGWYRYGHSGDRWAAFGGLWKPSEGHYAAEGYDPSTLDGAQWLDDVPPS